jgi:dipeptidyl aminopeptidase/acylaminoacyl peptidase
MLPVRPVAVPTRPALQAAIRTRRHPALTGALAAVLLAAVPVAAQQKPTLKPADYGRWETPGFGSLSPDGRWIAIPISRVNEENELRIRQLASDSAVTAAYGTQAAFSTDSHWAGYLIGLSEKDRKAAEKANKPIRTKLGLLDLQTGKVETVADIAGFAFSGDGRFLAMKGFPAKDQKHKGVDLIVRDLATGDHTTFGNASEFAWQDEGRLLAFTIDAETRAGNGVKLYDPGSGMLRALDSDTSAYKQLVWRDKGDDLAVLRVRGDSAFEADNHVLLAWTGLAGKTMAAHVLDPATMAGFPAETRIVEFRRPSWAEDGRTVYFGITPWQRKEPKDTSAVATEDKPGVEIWHAKDVDILPTQKVRAQRDREMNYLAAWRVRDNRFIEIANDLMEEAQTARSGAVALASDGTPYERERMFGPLYKDLYVIDVATGTRSRIKERLMASNAGDIGWGYISLSPTGRYVLYLEKDHWWTYDVQRKVHVNITEKVATSFINTEDDHTVAQKPPFGGGIWTPGDRSVLLYDKYDIWEVAPDGSKATRLSEGAADRVQHRVVRLDIEEVTVDPAKPVYVALYGDRTKKYGYGTIQRGRPEQRLLFLEKNVGRLAKAKEADVFAYVTMSFDDSPDYLVGGPALADARQVTNTNPFMGEYAWGRSELIDFKNRQGKDLQGALFYPANYEPGKQYPMIVYIYEIVSPSVRSFSTPSERNAYNPAVWTQNGYFVLQPDIVYRDRDPGLSAKDALEPAVETVVATGMVDPKRVGLVGHSWGGYQTAFMSSVSRTFAAGVAGAPLTELASMYLSIYWNSGGTDARIFEVSQGRMEVPPWEDLDAYTRNSAVWNIEKMETPLLMTFGDKDGAVDWHQGIVLYNAARRENKDLVMLVYEGENHGLAKKPNQIDYHRRVMQWFNHYLKGEPAPDWLKDGVKFLDKDKELKKAITSPISND